MPTISDYIAIGVGLSSLLVVIWNTFANRKKAAGDLAEIYKSIAGIDAKTFLELKQKVDKLERARKFKASIEFEVDGEGARLGKVDLYPIEK